MQPCPTCGGMGIDANGYCTQCRTYRGVPQAPQQPTSGTPYSGAPYGGQQPYAGYPTSSGPSYPDPVSAPPTAYGATYGATSSAPSGRNKYLMPILALSGVLVILVVAIVVVAVVRKGDDKKDPVANPTGAAASGKASTKPSSAIDQCLVGTWTTKSYTIQLPVDGVGNVPVTLQKNGSTIKFDPAGKISETYENTTFTGTINSQGTSVPFTLTINATSSANVATSNGSLTYSNVQSSGTENFKAPSVQMDETDPFEADDNPAKYACSGDTLTVTTQQTTQTAQRTSTSY